MDIRGKKTSKHALSVIFPTVSRGNIPTRLRTVLTKALSDALLMLSSKSWRQTVTTLLLSVALIVSPTFSAVTEHELTNCFENNSLSFFNFLIKSVIWLNTYHMTDTWFLGNTALLLDFFPFRGRDSRFKNKCRLYKWKHSKNICFTQVDGKNMFQWTHRMFPGIDPDISQFLHGHLPASVRTTS